MARQRVRDALDETLAPELHARDVDRQQAVEQAAIEPIALLAAGLVEHPVADCADLTGLLGHRDESVGWVVPSVG